LHGGAGHDHRRNCYQALELFRAHGVAQPHERDESAPRTEADRRYRSCDVQNQLKLFGSSGHDYGKKVASPPCSSARYLDLG